MSVGDWSAAVLCTEADVVAIEATWLTWTDDTAARITAAKEEIERKLRYAFRDKELATKAADVLDLVANPEVLKAAAVCKTLELTAVNGVTMGGDRWSELSKYYAKKFNEEFDIALGMIAFDKDESGAIDDTEKYQVSAGVTLTRGGAVPRIPTSTNDDR